MKSIVTPGEIISDKPEHLVSGAYLKDGKTYSEYLGVLYSTPQGLQVVPLQGKYSPKIGDTIYGVVLVEDNFGYVLDIKSYRYPYVAKRTLDRMTLAVGDIIFAKVNRYTKQKLNHFWEYQIVEDNFRIVLTALLFQKSHHYQSLQFP